MANQNYNRLLSRISLIPILLIFFSSVASAQNDIPKNYLGIHLYGAYETDLETPGAGVMIDYNIFLSKSISIGPFIHGSYIFEKTEEVNTPSLSVSASASYFTGDIGGKFDLHFGDLTLWAGGGLSYTSATLEAKAASGNVSFSLLDIEDDEVGASIISGIGYNISNSLTIFVNEYYNTSIENLVVGAGVKFKL